MTFNDFRRWALNQSRAAARRWEDPRDDEIKVLLAVDDYQALHVIPLPPIYLRVERGYLSWLAGALPDIVANRSLQRVAFRTSAWTTADERYERQPLDDPNRSELLLLNVAEKGRFEVWEAPIERSSAGLPGLGPWELMASDEDGLDGNLPYHIGIALEKRGPGRGPTIPAADMVLGPWDVPPELFPLPEQCGPLDFAKERTTSTYFALFRPESPGPVIASQAFVYADAGSSRGHMQGAMETLTKAENEEFDGPSLADECHYFEGMLGGLRRYTAIWRYPAVLCEVAVGGPPGRFTKKDVYHYAAIQDQRARAHLDSDRVAS